MFDTATREQKGRWRGALSSSRLATSRGLAVNPSRPYPRGKGCLYPPPACRTGPRWLCLTVATKHLRRLDKYRHKSNVKVSYVQEKTSVTPGFKLPNSSRVASAELRQHHLDKPHARLQVNNNDNCYVWL